jgi:ribonuclease R
MARKRSPDNPEELEQSIRQILARPIRGRLRVRDILNEIGAGPGARRTVKRLIAEITQSDFGKAPVDPEFDAETVVPKAPARTLSFRSSSEEGGLIGRLQLSGRGHGIVLLETASGTVTTGWARASQVFVSRKNLGEAFHGDRVITSIIRRPSTGKDLPEGIVTRILERANTKIVGTYYRDRRGGTVVPRDERLRRTVSVPLPDPALRVTEGSFVVVEIGDWPPYPAPLSGRVIEFLGDDQTKNIDVTLIIKGTGVADEFPSDALEEAGRIATRGITEEEVERRFDFRTWTTFTMDGATAKDFDDALSIARLDNGLWRLGVHIADVSHYVNEGSVLDREAASRGTSIYPVDRVIPMLPEALSNDICSLRPDVDRLVLSCIMDIDERGLVHEYSIHEGIIRSSFRLIYEDVQAVMDGKAEPELARRLGPIWLQLENLYRLRRVLTEMRLARGALDLDVPETEVLFEGDEVDYAALPEPSRRFPPRGDRPVKGVVRRARLESHRVVEECMLLANEVIAAHLFSLGIPSIYRVHEQPDLEKLKNLSTPLSQLGVRLSGGGKGLGVRAIQAALEQAGKIEHGSIARRLILRSMMRARYAEFNAGHFGLGSTCYTHFTSPIRRYPDLLVHRLLRETLNNGVKGHGTYTPPVQDPGSSPAQPYQGQNRSRIPNDGSATENPQALPPSRIQHWERTLPVHASHCSERERRSEDIERDCNQLKTLEYMRGFHGEPFSGFVTSVLTFGFFVELDQIPVEGLVPLRGLDSDYYEFDEERLVLTGRRSRDTIRLGDRVIVAVENIDLHSLTMDFALLDRIRPEGYDPEKQHQLNTESRAREQRHQERRPNHRGFQSRGRSRRGKGGRR